MLKAALQLGLNTLITEAAKWAWGHASRYLDAAFKKEPEVLT